MKRNEKCEARLHIFIISMEKEKLKGYLKFSYLLLFLIVETVFYSLFILRDFNSLDNIDSTLFKFIAIITIVAFYILNFILNTFIEKKLIFDSLLVLIALIFTLISDTFLLYLNSYFEIGVGSFIIVQLAYFTRIVYSLKLSKKRIYVSIISRVSLFIIALIVLLSLGEFSLLYLLTAFYFINIVFNFVDSLISYISMKNDKRRNILLMFTLGLLLFIGCDVFVGLSNISGFGGSIIWIFYLPSQVLISLSATRLFGFSLREEI